MATYEITAELVLKPVIAEAREVAQALNEFADTLERIDTKYSGEPERVDCETAKCENCVNHGYCDSEWDRTKEKFFKEMRGEE